jgi:hypothetical protein
MQLVRFFHWHVAEAQERGERIRSAGYDVECSPPTPNTLSDLRKNPPAAVVVDLERLPAQGRDIGIMLRTHKSTRNVPLVFVGGKPEKVSGVKKLLPDAVYTSWSRIRSSLKRAIAHPPLEPVRHTSVFAGYAGTPLPKKLGIKEHSKVALVGAPEDFEKTLGNLPESVSIRRRASAGCDLIIWFTKSSKDLEQRFLGLGMLAGKGGLWVVWPKKTSGVKTDLTQAVVRKTGLALGLVDYKVCSVDATWTGLRFTRRKKK